MVFHDGEKRGVITVDRIVQPSHRRVLVSICFRSFRHRPHDDPCSRLQRFQAGEQLLETVSRSRHQIALIEIVGPDHQQNHPGWRDACVPILNLVIDPLAIVNRAGSGIRDEPSGMAIVMSLSRGRQ